MFHQVYDPHELKTNVVVIFKIMLMNRLAKRCFRIPAFFLLGLPTEAKAKSVWRRRVVAGRDGRFDPAPQKAAGFESDTLESAKDLRGGTEIYQSPDSSCFR